MTVVANVENLLYGSRSLVGFTEEGDYVSSWPELTHESLRAINHLTSHGPIPAPTLYRVLGELKGIGHLLPQACASVAGRLFRLALLQEWRVIVSALCMLPAYIWRYLPHRAPVSTAAAWSWLLLRRNPQRVRVAASV